MTAVTRMKSTLLGLDLTAARWIAERFARAARLPSERADAERVVEAIRAAEKLTDHIAENRLALKYAMALPFPECECGGCALARAASGGAA